MAFWRDTKDATNWNLTRMPETQNNLNRLSRGPLNGQAPPEREVVPCQIGFLDSRHLGLAVRMFVSELETRKLRGDGLYARSLCQN